MARKSGSQTVETSGEGLNDPRFISGRDQPSIAINEDILSDDPLPIFLSSDIGGPRMPVPEIAWDRHKSIVASRILKVGILAASAIAIVFGLLSREDKRAVVENASASLVGALAAPYDAVGRLLTSNVQAAVADQALPGTATVSPTRAEITAAFQTALQSQAEIRQPPVCAAAAATSRCRRTRNIAETGKGPDCHRRYCIRPIVARTGGRCAGGQRSPDPGADLRSCRTRKAECTEHCSRSGNGAHLVPEGRPVRLPGCATAP